MTKRLLAAVLLLTSLAGAHVLPAEQVETLQRALRHIYSLEFDAARKILEEMTARAPEDPAGYTYLAIVQWVEELSKKQELSIDRFSASDFFSADPKYRVKIDPAVEQRFRETSDRAIEKSQARLRANPSDKAALYLLGVAYQSLASFESALKRSWWSAYRNGSLTHRYHSRLRLLEPDLADLNVTFGVFDYVTGSLDWKTRWMALLMGYAGSKTRGKQRLQLVADKGVLAADDARLVLALIYTRERDFQKADSILAELWSRYPKNYLLGLDRGGLALHLNNPQRAIEIYNDILRRRDASQPGYAALDRSLLYTRMGVAVRRKGDYAAAVTWFERALGAAVQPSSKTMSRLELGKTLDLLKRRDDAVKQYQLVSSAEDYAGTQSEARLLLVKPYSHGE